MLALPPSPLALHVSNIQSSLKNNEALEMESLIHKKQPLAQLLMRAQHPFLTSLIGSHAQNVSPQRLAEAVAQITVKTPAPTPSPFGPETHIRTNRA